MSKTKKTTLVIVCVVVALLLIALAIALPLTLMPKKLKGGKPFVYEISEDGKYVFFGTYPQSLKNEDVTISGEPDANGYYTGSDGEKYVKQVCASFETLEEEDGEAVDKWHMTRASNGIEMQPGQEYYFKVEKIKWRVLVNNDGEISLVCDNILHGMAYQPHYMQLNNGDNEYYATNGAENPTENDILTDESGQKVYANNYKYSELRKFLTGEFYTNAFTDTQKGMIKLTTVDNSKETTNVDGQSENKYCCPNTEDYVYALSYKDLFNTDYGFVDEESNGDVLDPNKAFKTTDFAKATGAATITLEYISNGDELDADELEMLAPVIDSGAAWLRSPYSCYGNYAFSAD